MAMSVPEVGKTIEGPAFRDAIHVAVAPMEAAHDLEPGDHIAVAPDGRAQCGGEHVAVVDPFLKKTVKQGERFFAFVYPSTIEHLRHAWTHPAFKARTPGVEA